MFIPDRTASTFHPYQAQQKGIKTEDYPYENNPGGHEPAMFIAGIWNEDGSLRCLFQADERLRFSVDATAKDSFTINHSMSLPVMFENPGDSIILKLSERDDGKRKLNSLINVLSKLGPEATIEELPPKVLR